MVGEIMYSKVVGVTFDNRQQVIEKVKKGDKLKLVPEPTNAFDPNAISVEWVGNKEWAGSSIGYIARGLAGDLSDRLKRGFEYEVTATDITGGTEDRPTRGVNIEIKVTKDGSVK